ncbi:MAG: glycosyltransferase [Chitinophagaceae bacterium]
MKLAIITSEPLNPLNTLGSTFELTQAQVLSRSYEVTIIAVTAEDSLSANVKALLRKIFFLSGRAQTMPYTNILKGVTECLKYLLLRKKIVRRHLIENVTVYEGIGYCYVSPRTFTGNLRAWMKAGLNGFAAYCEENGAPELIHAHGRFLNAGALALEIKKKYGINYIYTEHSTHFQSNDVPVQAVPILNQIIDHASLYIAVSESLLEYVSKCLHRDIPNAVVIPNVVDQLFEAPLKKCVHTVPPFEFVNICNLEQKKGLDVLLKSFQKAFKGDPRYKLSICGDGPCKDQLEQLTRDLNLTEIVQFLGRKSKREIVTILDGCAVFVSSSRIETFGVVIIEAISRGLPVIGTRSGGPEFIITDVCGSVVAPDNIDQLAEAMKKIVEEYSLYDRNRIRNYALQHFGTSIFYKKMNEIYHSFN